VDEGTFAQTTAKADPREAVPPSAGTLKVDFAKSSLRTLKMIEGETGQFTIGQDGGFLVPRHTSEAMDNLDLDAETSIDTAVVKTLNDFLTARLMNNTGIATFHARARLALTVKNLRSGDLEISALLSKAPR
jgi:hypothetical protein